MSVSGSGSSYEISLSGSPTNGTTTFTIGAGVATDALGNGNTASTSTDNTVTYDTVAPSVAVTGVNGATRTFPYSTNVDVTSISGTCGTASGDLTAVNWSIGLRSGSATCSAGTWASGTFAAISADGTYTADATQADAAGNAGNATDQHRHRRQDRALRRRHRGQRCHSHLPLLDQRGRDLDLRNVRHRQRRPDRGQLVDRPALGLGDLLGGDLGVRHLRGNQRRRYVYGRRAPRQTPPAMPGNATDRTVIVDKTAPLRRRHRGQRCHSHLPLLDQRGRDLDLRNVRHRSAAT